MMDTATESRTIDAPSHRPLGPYEFVATPPIQLILNTIIATCPIGGCVRPGIRVLGDAAGVSLGLVTDCLRQLDADGWIRYDGRTITLLRTPDCDQEPDRSPDRSLDEGLIDQVIDHAIETAARDRSPDRSLVARSEGSAVQRARLRPRRNRRRDRSGDRSDFPPRPPMVLTKLTTGIIIARDSGGSGGNAECDQPNDQIPGAAHVLAELGADPKIIADALRERPDLTPDQVLATWEHYKARIAESDGRLNSGVFFHAIRRGQLHRAPPDPAQPIPVAAYAGKDAFKLGSDTSGLAPPDAEPPRADEPPPPESIGDHARRLLPNDASTADWVFVQTRLARGDSDDGALLALSSRRQPRGAA